mgnify:CR=1 FL=1
MYIYYLTHLEKYHKAIKIFNIVGAFIILILLLLLIFPNNPVSKYIETNRLGYDKEVCWNRATDDFKWTNGCKGAKGVNGCTTVMVDFTEPEKTQYQSWVKAGKPITKGCE